jgi:hypothetical protein
MFTDAVVVCHVLLTGNQLCNITKCWYFVNPGTKQVISLKVTIHAGQLGLLAKLCEHEQT